MTPKPEISMPAAEATFLAQRYDVASVILEYGSGGSTELAASLPGKLVFSVESDRAWARRMELVLARRDTPSPAIIHHVDIGETGAWGRPKDHSGWQGYHRYPLSIWDQPFFRQPDTVLIDGRFRVGCMAAVLMRTQRKVTVLFDDYANRPVYHAIEKIVAPRLVVGRMAVFDVDPGMVRDADLTFLVESLSRTTLSDVSLSAYQTLPENLPTGE
jgi:hypothetical protein